MPCDFLSEPAVPKDVFPICVVPKYVFSQKKYFPIFIFPLKCEWHHCLPLRALLFARATEETGETAGGGNNCLSMDTEVLTTRKGGTKLLHQGYIFYRKDVKKGRTYWTCVKKKECRATAITVFNEGAVQVVKERQHSHAPNREEVEAEKALSNMKRMATEHPELPPAQILRTELPKLSEGTISQLPERENLKKAMRRERVKDQPSNPLSIEELHEIPDR